MNICGGTPIVVLVCGGRDFKNARLVNDVLNDIRISILIEGGARGADRLARMWAEDNGTHFATVPALWDKYSKSAGPKRNRAMLLLKPDLVVAFPGGNGTADMVRAAKVAGVKVLEVEA